MTENFIPLSVPCFNGNELEYVKNCIETGWVSSAGSYVQKFEEGIVRTTGAMYAVATVNGTAALHIALVITGVGSGDEVIVPTLTFIAPVNAVRYVNANPIFMDCDEHLNIDVDKLTEFCERECHFDGINLVNKRTKAKVKAVIPVHIFGHPVNIAPIKELSTRFNLKIVEDATESLGSSYKYENLEGVKTGTVGDVGCLSFNGNKIITAGGGGMILTDFDEFAAKAKYLTTQAKDNEETFIHNEIGYNYRLTNIQAALGCAQLERLVDYVRIKRMNFEIYRKHLGEIEGLKFIYEPSYANSNYWCYTIMVNEKIFGINSSCLKEKLKKYGIESRQIWELNHRQKPYKNYQAYKIEKSVKYHYDGLNIPSSVNLTRDDIGRVCEVICKVH